MPRLHGELSSPPSLQQCLPCRPYLKKCCVVCRVPSAEMHNFLAKHISLLATQPLVFHALTNMSMEG